MREPAKSSSPSQASGFHAVMAFFIRSDKPTTAAVRPTTAPTGVARKAAPAAAPVAAAPAPTLAAAPRPAASFAPPRTGKEFLDGDCDGADAGRGPHPTPKASPRSGTLSMAPDRPCSIGVMTLSPLSMIGNSASPAAAAVSVSSFFVRWSFAPMPDRRVLASWLADPRVERFPADERQGLVVLLDRAGELRYFVAVLDAEYPVGERRPFLFVELRQGIQDLQHKAPWASRANIVLSSPALNPSSSIASRARFDWFSMSSSRTPITLNAVAADSTRVPIEISAEPQAADCAPVSPRPLAAPAVRWLKNSSWAAVEPMLFERWL